VSSFKVFVRHQIGAIMSTAIDFSTMIGWVELGIGTPVSGTAVGAAAGALSNFTLGRHWIFVAHGGPVASQMLRYALVSLFGLGWNTLGQHLLLKATGLPYPITRAMVAVAVGVFWNFPMQRWFVFHKPVLPEEPV
jgi:putative flippase GtrA